MSLGDRIALYGLFITALSFLSGWLFWAVKPEQGALILKRLIKSERFHASINRFKKYLLGIGCVVFGLSGIFVGRILGNPNEPKIPRGLFRLDGEVPLFDEAQHAYSAIPKANNASCSKVVYLYYIKKESQVALHGCLNISVVNPNKPADIPVRVWTSTSGKVNPVDYVKWGGSLTRPEVDKNIAEDEGQNAIQLGQNSFTNFLVFQYFDEVLRSDDFVVRLSQFYNRASQSGVNIECYVVVRNEDLAFWNPNKYLYAIDPETKNLTLSGHVLEGFASPNQDTTGALKDARCVLQAMMNARLAPNIQDKNYNDVVKTIGKEVFPNGRFAVADEKAGSHGVTVFRFMTTPKPNDLLLVYGFQLE